MPWRLRPNDDTLGTLALAAMLLGAISVGSVIHWPWGVTLLAVGCVGWLIYGR